MVIVLERIPKPNAARSRARKGCHLSIEVVTIIKAILRMSKKISHISGCCFQIIWVYFFSLNICGQVKDFNNLSSRQKKK
jgi:hypothetical protein